MFVRTKIEIVTGFLGSGKTSFINALLKTTLNKGEKVIVLCCEKGETEISQDIYNNELITIKEYPIGMALTVSYFDYIISLFNPYRLIIEHNGTCDIEKTLRIFDSRRILKKAEVGTIYNVIEAKDFIMYAENFGQFMMPPLKVSHMVVLNNTDLLKEGEEEKVKSLITDINVEAYILSNKKIQDLEDSLRKAKVLDRGLLKKAMISLKG